MTAWHARRRNVNEPAGIDVIPGRP